MRRKLVKALLTVAAFACLIVASGMASSAILGSGARSTVPAKPEFRATLDEPSDSQRPTVPPAAAANINFDETFSDLARIRNANDTPRLREKFRNLGWARITSSR